MKKYKISAQYLPNIMTARTKKAGTHYKIKESEEYSKAFTDIPLAKHL